MLIDSHTHINFISFKTDADEVIQRSLDNNIWLVNIGAQYSTSRRAVEIANKYSQGVYAAIGLHPVHLSSDIIETVSIDGKEIQFATKKEIFNYDKYKKLAESSDRVVAIGEVGVDYFYFDRYNLPVAENREIQLNIFKEFIRLSQELNLPLAVHCRGTKADPFSAYDDIYEAFKDSQTRGVIHCFGGSLEQAKKFIDLGFYVGFTGVITFKKKAEELQEIVKQLPLDRILIETDAPFISPEPYRGRRNEPLYVKYVARKIAELKNISYEEVTEATTANAKTIFNIPRIYK